MSADLILGGTSIGLAAIDSAVKVIQFLRTWAQDAKHMGADVRSFRTRLTCECARLEALSAFLKIEDGGKRLIETFPNMAQQAVLGMLQELEVLFGQYSTYVADHSIKELQRGYAVSELRSEMSGLELAQKGGWEGEEIQKRTSFVTKTEWGLLRKRKIGQLIIDIEEWNSRLMSFVQSGLCLGKGPFGVEAKHYPVL